MAPPTWPGSHEVAQLLDQLVETVADAVHDRLRNDPITLRRAPSRVLDVHEAAAYLGVSAEMIRREAHAGRIPHLKLGNRMRFAESALGCLAAGEAVRLIQHERGAYIADRLTDLAEQYGISEGDILLLVDEHSRRR